MNRFFITLVCCLTLAACGGVPLRSVPRLMQLSGELLDANPSEFMLALQVDARLVPPVGAVPMLVLKLQPREAGAFEPVDKKLPLQVTELSGAGLGLAKPAASRRWLLYSMPRATQLELQRIQTTIRQAKAKTEGKSGGSLSVGIEQNSLAVTEPGLANTRWDTWLQTRKVDGFFEVWSGTPAQLQQVAGQAK